MAGTVTLDSDVTTEPRARSRTRGKTTSINLNPMTRVGGALGVHAETDGDRITKAYVQGNLYRGYEQIVTGRDARDAMPLTSRMCGWMGGVHMTTSSLALEMAWGMRPPPMATALRSIAQATEAIWVHAAHLAVRAGPDYCASAVARTTPHIWRMAQGTKAPSVDLHGFETIADLMEALTPASGSYWMETIPKGRQVQEMISLIYGKWPHPSVLSPGTVGSTLTVGNFTEYFTRVVQSLDYVKRLLAIWDDLIDFMYEADPRMADLGVLPANFIHAGCWDDVRADYTYSTLDEIGRLRLCAPGVMVNGRLVTGNLSEVHQGIEEHLSHAFYEPSSDGGVDAAGQQLPAKHPWGRHTIPRPQAPDAAGKYSWCKAARWRGEVLESTPLGRLWLTAQRTDFPPNDFIECTGDSIKILVPMNYLPEVEVEWKIPTKVNALERLRADAYGIAFAGLCAAISLLRAFELTRMGEADTRAHHEVPSANTTGVGLWESGRGMNVHWLSTNKGRITSYQVAAADGWNGSPRDDAGKPGPIEQALLNSPLIEEQRSDAPLRGIDALRVIHSFDPCMACGVH